MDHHAIRKAYPAVVTISGDKAFDIDFKEVTLVQSDIDAARTTLNNELAATKYQRDRAAEYPPIADQLDDIYHNGIDGWKATIKATKDKYPKP